MGAVSASRSSSNVLHPGNSLAFIEHPVRYGRVDFSSLRAVVNVPLRFVGINLHGVLQMACDEHNIEPENRDRTVNILSRHVDDSLRHQRDFGTKSKSVYLWTCVKLGKFYGAYVALLYCLMKVLYLLNVFGQFFLLNRFLETDDYPFFGAHVLWDMLQGREWVNSGKFPRVTLCDFEIRNLGTSHELF